MADLRESFATLEDSATGEGKALIARVQGDAAAAQNGAIGFAFKDSAGNVILPTLDAVGNVPVVVDHKDLAGDVASGKEGLVAFSHKDSAGNLVLPQLDSNGNSKVIIDHLDQAGQAAAGKEGLVAFGFKDASGNLVLPQLSASGGISVSVAADTLSKKSPAGELAAGSASIALVTGAEIPLVASKVYKNIGFVASCRRDSLFQVIWLNDVTPTVLFEVIVGAGQYTVVGDLDDMTFTAGATGVQKLQLKAKNFEALSSLRGTLCLKEVV